MDNPIPGLLKLIDYGASGIGSVAVPMLAPWRSRREAKATLIDAKAESDSLKILAEGRATALQIISNAQSEARSTLADQNSIIDGEISIREAITQRLFYQEEKRQSNIVSVLNEAAENLGDKTVEEHEPDHDWTARFFNEVQDVSSDDMRAIWAKILAGEVERPGSTSARTLTVLKNLDRKAARLFNTLCSLCISLRPDGNLVLDARAPSMGGQPAQNNLQKYGLSFDSLNILNEYGLIISDYNSYYGVHSVYWNHDRKLRARNPLHPLYLPREILGTGTHARVQTRPRIPPVRGGTHASRTRTSEGGRPRAKPAVAPRPK